MPAKLTLKDVAARINLKHPHITLLTYTSLGAKATARCATHGEFPVTRVNVLMKDTTSGGCPGCVRAAKGDAKRVMSYVVFVERARAAHGDRYTYPEQRVDTVRQDVTYSCPEHGEVTQRAQNHLEGFGCKACSNASRQGSVNAKNSLGFDGFVANARKVHGDRYSYPEQPYRNRRTQVRVTCAKHGEFTQAAGDHMGGNGCQQCYVESKALTFAEFVENARNVHGDRYAYPEQALEGSRSYVSIVCPDHGPFQQLANTHTSGCGCPDCVASSLTSKAEDEIAKWLESLGERVVRNSRQVLKPLEVDLWLPERKLAIEHDGLYWHSEAVKAKSYHKQKQDLADAAGVRLIQVLEDEWLLQRDKVKAVIRLALGKAPRLMARKLAVREVTAPTARAFYATHHLQGFVGGRHAGLYDGNVLVACATTGRSRFRDELELLRYATAGVTVVGGLGRLLKALTNPGDVVASYCDRRWFTGAAYLAAGFTYSHTSAPGYFWVKGSRRLSRHKFQKHRIAEMIPDADLSLTEVEIAQAAGYLRLFDAGQQKFLYTRP